MTMSTAERAELAVRLGLDSSSDGAADDWPPAARVLIPQAAVVQLGGDEPSVEAARGWARAAQGLTHEQVAAYQCIDQEYLPTEWTRLRALEGCVLASESPSDGAAALDCSTPAPEELALEGQVTVVSGAGDEGPGVGQGHGNEGVACDRTEWCVNMAWATALLKHPVNVHSS